jgi:hypothetical protein
VHYEVFRDHSENESDSGSSVVGFVLVAPLLVSIFIAIGQIAMLVADKSVLDSAAAVGARAAAAADASNLSGRNAALAVLGSRGDGFRPDSISVVRERVGGIDYTVVTITRKVEISFLNQSVVLTSRSRALDERGI